MALLLSADLVIATRTVADGMETRVSLGDVPIFLTRPLFEAVVALAAGKEISASDAQTLLRAGILVDTEAGKEEQLAWEAMVGGGEQHPLASQHPERLVLHPAVVLGCEQLPQQLGADAVLPVSSLPVSMFVAPEQLGPLQRLSDSVRGAWRRLLRAAQAHGRPVDGDRARAMLEDLVRAELDADPALAAGFSIGEPFRIEPREPLQQDTVCYPFSALTLAMERGGGETTFATGERTIRVPMVAPDAVAACGRLLGLLSAGMGPEGIALFLDESPLARGLFGRLVALGLLAGAPREGTFARDLPPGTVVHLGHGGLLANLGGAYVLVDPWLVAASGDDDVPPPGAGDLPPLHAIFLTHHHWDHLHVETLLQLDKRVPIYVPAQDDTRPLRPLNEQFLRYLGFADVRSLNPGDEVSVGERGRVVATGFHGEDPGLIGFRGCGYVLADGDRAALVHSDSARSCDGSSLVTTGEAAGLRQRFGLLSPVFASRRQDRATMVDGSWEFLLSPSERWVQPVESCDHDSASLAALGTAVGAKRMVLYCEGGAPWYPGGRRHHPGLEMAQTAIDQYLWEPLDEVSATVRRAGLELMVAHPYQRFQLGGGLDGVVRCRSAAGAY